MGHKTAILQVLSNWDQKCRGWWYGYDQLLLELEEDHGISTDIDTCKKSLKLLSKNRLVKSEPIFDEATGLLNGKGYFINT